MQTPIPSPRHLRSLAALTVAAALASFFLALGRAPLFDVDEGAFSQATLEMFQRGDFLSTYLNGVPRYDKPILVYWLQAAAVLALGPTEWAFRLPSALCGCLWCGLILAFARQSYGASAGFAAAAVAATSVGVFAIGRAATADALLNMLIAASMFAAWLHLQRGGRKWLYAAYAAAALGVLAKGPVAVLIPAAVTLVFCLLRRDLRSWLHAVLDWRAVLLFLAIAAPWYVVILTREGWAFVEGFVMKHNVQRFGGTLQGHAGSLLYYFPVVLLATLPHTGLFLKVISRWSEAWRDDLQCYLLLWFAFVFVFFSFSGTKLPHYVLYGMSGVFVLMGAHAAQVPSRWWLLAPALIFFPLLLGLPWFTENAASIWKSFSGKAVESSYELALADASGAFPVLYYVYAGAAALLVLWIAADRRVEAPHAAAASGALSVSVLAAFVLPAAGALLQQPVKEAARIARERNYDVVMWGINAPSFSVYYGRPTPGRRPGAGEVVVTRSRRLAELPPYDVIYARKGVALVRLKG